jgi:hypothetical protein
MGAAADKLIHFDNEVGGNGMERKLTSVGKRAEAHRSFNMMAVVYVYVYVYEHSVKFEFEIGRGTKIGSVPFSSVWIFPLAGQIN